MSKGGQIDEIARLRKAQTRRVMPMIVNLLDRWEMLPNDIRGDLETECPEFYRAMDALLTAMDR